MSRYFLIVTHIGRADAIAAAREVCRQLVTAGATPVLPTEHWPVLSKNIPNLDQLGVTFESINPELVELTIVLGGDGTILRAAETTHHINAPLLGVNLGHFGFLAESEKDDLSATIARVLAHDYSVEDRMTIQVRAKLGSEVIYESWALNEASIEKAERERMLEVVIEVDRRPLSSFGCDGVLIATPTGSTAYAFSAGGPVIWPSVAAILLVPLSAHALFARPLVVGPESALAVEILHRAEAKAVIWCDGRRSFNLPPGARVVVRRSPKPVRLARLHQAPFTDRLVNKFQLPVVGWRGPEAD